MTVSSINPTRNMVIWPELAERISDEEPVRFRAFRVAALWLGMAVLGVVLALLWRSIGRSTLI